MTDTQAVNARPANAGQATRSKRVRQTASRRSALSSRVGLNYAFVAATIVLGWSWRDRGWVNAEAGLGYWLGITGASLMLLLLLYPLRKRLANLRWMGPTRHWFKVHMLFGVLGPLLILFHCNFQLGSPNSTVALICMILVAASGVVGRYFYARIHHGLYGSKATLKELQTNLAGARTSHRESIAFVPLVAQRLDEANQELLTPVTSLPQSVRRAFVWSVRSRWLYWSLSRAVKLQLRREAEKSPAIAAHRQRLLRAAQNYLRNSLQRSRKVAEFSLYERLFGLWHVFHLPLFLLMVLTALAHVLAVHMY